MAKVISIVKNDLNDLTIAFDNQFILNIICDITDKIEHYFIQNWYLSVEDLETVLIANSLEFLKEKNTNKNNWWHLIE